MEQNTINIDELGIKPIAWARKWHVDGEKPEKVKKENGRWAWPAKFKMLPVTEGRVAKDDVPLVAANADLIDRLRKAEAERDGLAARLEVIPEGGPDGIECRDATIALQDARIAELEARLKDLEDQEPVAWACWIDGSDPSIERPQLCEYEPRAYKQRKPLFARPVPAEAQQAEPVRLNEWQPIETAPGNEILILATEFDGPGDWRIKCGYRDDENKRGWKVWGASWKPTRWIKMPEPPTARANGYKVEG